VKTESPSSPESRDLSKDSKQRQQELTPGSVRSGSTWNNQDLSDDDVSICTKYDRGYTAAEKRYTDPTWTARHGTTESFTGIDVAPNSGGSLADLIHVSIQSYGGSPGGEKEWLPFDKLFELINVDTVFQELLRVLGTELPEADLRSYAKRFALGEGMRMTQGHRLVASLRF
jgi:hypothetical protein